MDELRDSSPGAVGGGRMDTVPLNWTLTSYHPSPWVRPPDCKP